VLTDKLWPESKVLDLMGVAFYYGALMMDKYGKTKEWPELWEMFKKSRVEPRLKYVNPDKRCNHPVDLDEVNYCWGYAVEVDKGGEISMEELCKDCEFFREEVKT